MTTLIFNANTEQQNTEHSGTSSSEQTRIEATHSELTRKKREAHERRETDLNNWRNEQRSAALAATSGNYTQKELRSLKMKHGSALSEEEWNTIEQRCKSALSYGFYK